MKRKPPFWPGFFSLALGHEWGEADEVHGLKGRASKGLEGPRCHGQPPVMLGLDWGEGIVSNSVHTRWVGIVWSPACPDSPSAAWGRGWGWAAGQGAEG